eukprot:scaffold9451_cov103-Isochrysis_galbana.AAC.3
MYAARPRMPAASSGYRASICRTCARSRRLSCGEALSQPANRCDWPISSDDSQRTTDASSSVSPASAPSLGAEPSGWAASRQLPRSRGRWANRVAPAAAHRPPRKRDCRTAAIAEGGSGRGRATDETRRSQRCFVFAAGKLRRAVARRAVWRAGASRAELGRSVERS